jgi:cytoskeleton protein RodZ
MGAFGERLQREREMRGITLEEMSESTKISSRSLRALETEEFDKLPGGIFNKGFVRAYARHIGIDEDQAVADFVVASGGEKDQPLPDPPEPRAAALGQRAEGHANWRAFALLTLLLATAVVAIWKLGPAAVHKVTAELTARLSSPPAPPAAPKVAPQNVPEEAPSPAAAAAAAAAAARKPPTKAKSVTVAESVPAAAPPAPSEVVAASPQVPAATFVVQVRAMQDAWVQIVADGRLMSEGVLVPPAEKRVRAAKEVVIKTGNAAGVEVSFNGQPLPPLGEENQTATVTLNAGGAQR